MKKRILTIALIAIGCTSFGQSRGNMQQLLEQRESSFNQLREQKLNEYEAFLQKRNAQFAEYMSRSWERYNMMDGKAAPQRTYPKEPVAAPKEQPKLAPVKVPIKRVVKIPAIQPVAPEFKPLALPKPKRRPTTPSVAPTESFQFYFAGSQLSVALSDEHKFTLKDVKERSVSDAWSDLGNSDISEVVQQSLKLKESLKLNDYLYVLMLDTMCDSFFGESYHNESRLLKSYILTQSGYDAKCARTSAGLAMLLAIEETIFQKPYLIIDGTMYYIIDEPADSNHQYYTFAQKFSEHSKSCSMRIEEEFVVNNKMSTPKSLASERYPTLKVEVAVDKNLLDIYDNYPRCKWDVYAKAPMSSKLAAIILPLLKSKIEGKSEAEAANMILNFVQTAFEYKTDDDYFGYERSLFVDETFYYPYSDCEDRSILYANLMKKLLGLDVVLLHYPNHLATAVRFGAECKGDYVMVGNKRYTICDPTYIGANIGVAMPQYKGVAAEVVVL